MGAQRLSNSKQQVNRKEIEQKEVRKLIFGEKGTQDRRPKRYIEPPNMEYRISSYNFIIGYSSFIIPCSFIGYSIFETFFSTFIINSVRFSSVAISSFLRRR